MNRAERRRLKKSQDGAIERNPEFNENEVKTLLMLNDAYRLKDEEKFTECQMVCQQILMKDHYNPVANYIMSELALDEGKYRSAEVLIKRALETSPDCDEFKFHLGNVLTEGERGEEALEIFDDLLEKEPFPEIMKSKGHLLQELGRKEEAENFYKEMIDRYPCAIVAFHGLSNLKQGLTADDPYFKRFKKISENTLSEAEPGTMTGLYYTLGDCYHKQKEYELAFNSYLNGSISKRKELNINPEISLQNLRAILTTYNDKMNDQFGKGNPDDTPIFICGMPRSGTTLTEQIISSHSTVHPGGELDYMKKVLHNFASANNIPMIRAMHIVQPHILDSLGEQYIKRLLFLNREADHITDKMPHNFQNIPLMRAILPNSKIIHLDRDPISNCWSLFRQNFGGRHDYSLDLVTMAKYHKLYQRLIKKFQNLYGDIFYNLKYESLIEDPEGESKKLLEYCELPWEDQCLEFYKNKRQVKTASISQVREKIYTSSKASWEPYREFLKPLIDELEKEDAPEGLE